MPRKLPENRGSSLVDSHARTLAEPTPSEKDSKVPEVDSGLNSKGSFRKPSPSGSSSKTVPISELKDLEQSSRTFGRSGILGSTQLLVDSTLAPQCHTKENGSGLWRTPCAQSGGSNLKGIQKSLDKGENPPKRPSGHPCQIKLDDQVKEPRLWPTPTARDGKGGYQGGRLRGGKPSWDVLDVACQSLREDGGLLHPAPTSTLGSPQDLNPDWTEALQGFPVGWTDLGKSEIQ